MIENTHTYRVHCDTNADVAVEGPLVNPVGGHGGPIDVTVPDHNGQGHLLAELERRGWRTLTYGYDLTDERSRVFCPKCVDQGLAPS